MALHGRFGEDGTLQSLLERAGVPYTGSDSQASRLAFSKSASKERFLQYRVPTPNYVLIHASDDASRIGRLAGQVGYPLVVKPDRQGSSLGVSIVETADALPDALRRCFALDDFGLIEAAVLGSEWTVGLFDELVLPPILIETSRQFYDYRAKYEDDDTRVLFRFLIAARRGPQHHRCRNSCGPVTGNPRPVPRGYSIGRAISPMDSGSEHDSGNDGP